METEIERKFLIAQRGVSYATPHFMHVFCSIDALAEQVLAEGRPYHQGYLPQPAWQNAFNQFGVEPHFNPIEVRVRQKGDIDPAYEFTVKGDGTLERDEIPLEITKTGFDNYWPITLGKRIEKTRLKVDAFTQTLELDVYRDRDLFVAEVEFKDRGIAKVFPALGYEITDDPAYKNVNLSG